VEWNEDFVFTSLARRLKCEFEALNDVVQICSSQDDVFRGVDVVCLQMREHFEESRHSIRVLVKVSGLTIHLGLASDGARFTVRRHNKFANGRTGSGPRSTPQIYKLTLGVL